jgi:hypothetical protein
MEKPDGNPERTYYLDKPIPRGAQEEEQYTMVHLFWRWIKGAQFT